MSGEGGYGGYGGSGGYQGTGGPSGGGGPGQGSYSIFEDPVDEFLDNNLSAFASSETARRLEMMGLPAMEEYVGARRGLIDDMISNSDPMEMADSRRGARRFLQRMSEDPKGLARVLQSSAGIQDVARFMSELETQCYAVLMGNGQSGPMMPRRGSSSTGTGRGASMSGEWPGAMAPGMTPDMTDPRSGAQAGHMGQRGNQSGDQSALGGRHPSANRDPHSGDYVYGPSNNAGGRADDRRRGGDRRSNAGGQSGSHGQPSMYGAYFSWGRH